MTASASRYTAQIDLSDFNDSHALAIARVPANSRVLDLGAADGSVAAVLTNMGCQVWGVEKDPVAAKAAKEVCEEVVVADLNDLEFTDIFEKNQFDVVLMLDILEHLMNPDEVLARVASVLADGGWGILSIPNVTHVSLRLSLLQGRFRYTDTGLLDRTHLRFYDREGLDALLADAGWAMFDIARVTRPLGSTEIQVEDPDPEIVRRIGSDREALTYQFVISAAPCGSTVLELPPMLPAAVAQRELVEARSQIELLNCQLVEARSQIDLLQHELSAAHQIRDLYTELERVHVSSLDRRNQLRELLGAVLENVSQLRRGLDGS